jgi:effector-binding domain-containing protein
MARSCGSGPGSTVGGATPERFVAGAVRGAMVVDFAIKKSPAMRTLSRTWKGSWQEKRIQSEFEQLERYAKEHSLKPTRWLFAGNDAMNQWLVAIEVSGKARGDGTVRVKTFPASRVASITFDPDALSPRVVYHGLFDWLRSQKKEKAIRSVGKYREVYRGNPWKDKAAWSKTEIQAVVR